MEAVRALLGFDDKEAVLKTALALLEAERVGPLRGRTDRAAMMGETLWVLARLGGAAKKAVPAIQAIQRDAREGEYPRRDAKHALEAITGPPGK